MWIPSLFCLIYACLLLLKFLLMLAMFACHNFAMFVWFCLFFVTFRCCKALPILSLALTPPIPAPLKQGLINVWLPSFQYIWALYLFLNIFKEQSRCSTKLSTTYNKMSLPNLWVFISDFTMYLSILIFSVQWCNILGQKRNAAYKD